MHFRSLYTYRSQLESTSSILLLSSSNRITLHRQRFVSLVSQKAFVFGFTIWENDIILPLLFIFLHRVPCGQRVCDLFRLLRDGVEINKKDCEGQVRDALYSFWAYQLCILRAMTGFMDQEQRKEELRELYKYNWLLEYRLHPKVRKVALVQKYLGRKITDYILHQYLKTRLA